MSTRRKPIFHKIAGWPRQDTGVGFYRIVQPLRFLKRTGAVEDARTIPFSGDNTHGAFEFNDRTFMDISQDADVFWSTMIFSDEEFLKAMNLREWSGAKWIVDIDDNIYQVPMDNPMGNRVASLKEEIERCFRMADGITVSVPMLKRLYEPLNDNIFVQKNGLDPKIWKPLAKLKKPNERIRIGWRGAYGHKDDLELVYPALAKLKEKYDFDLVAFGTKPDRLDWKFEGWIGVLEYPEKLASLNLDIALCPLLDSSYNRCKSNLNWIENAALGTPVVYTPTENQQDLPGIAANTSFEWYEALEKLITDTAYRRKLGKQCQNHVWEHYDMNKNVTELAEWMNKLPRKGIER